MKYLTLESFTDFKCTGSNCQETCCGGWQIIVDDESYKYYQTVEGEFGDKLRAAIVDKDDLHVMNLVDDRCPFLDCNNLCDIYKNIGEDKLCATCKIFPRYEFIYNDLNVLGVSMGCPEVVEKIFLISEPIQFAYGENDNEFIDNGDIDWDKYNSNINLYIRCIDVLQNREMRLYDRLRYVAKEVVGCEVVEDRDYFGWHRLLATVIEKGELLSVSDNNLLMDIASDYAKKINANEIEWEDLALFEDSSYCIQYEQWAVCFFHRFFFKGCVEGSMEVYMKSMIYIYWIQLCFMSAYLNTDKTVKLQDQVQVTTMVSRFFEHSKLTMQCLIDIIEK